MTAVIRLKRHLDDEPLSALILNCKKRKKNDDSDSTNEVSTVLTFAGTVNNQDDDISSHISKLTKDDLEKSYKKHVPNVTSKNRQQTKEDSENNRFKIVNFFRSIDKETQALQSEAASTGLTVLDVESECPTGSTVPETDESEFVYDLYYTTSDDIEDPEGLHSELRVCPLNELIFDDGLPNDSDHDSDDSNDENNWRNDYPDEEDDDEDDDGSIREDDMRNAMECLSLGGDLSSDGDQDGFMYSIDSEAVGFEEDPDVANGSRYEDLYARFKLRQKQVEEQYNKDMYHGEVDDTDEDFYD